MAALRRLSTINFIVVVASLFLFVVEIEAVARPGAKLALTPPMGWSSWNTFRCQVNETLIKQVADVIAASPLKSAGYQYVNIDDCWQWCLEAEAGVEGKCLRRAPRNKNGQIQPDPTRFPSGMKALADYIHSKGLKFGLYTSSGELTCQNFTGSWTYEAIDAKSYASWDVDYLKLDACYTNTAMREVAYPAMSKGLRATGRDIVFSCDSDELYRRVGNTETPWVWAQGVCDLWRIWGDINDSWKSTLDILDHEVNLSPFAGPGGWNDPDMLTVGMGGQTLTQYKVQFSLWCILAAPLIMGNDVRNMKREYMDILTHKPLIAVNQDRLGIQGSLVRNENGTQVWARPLEGNYMAVALFNRDGSGGRDITVRWDDLWGNNLNGWTPPVLPFARVWDLWDGSYLGVWQDYFVARNLSLHDVAVLKIAPPTRN